MKPDLAMCANLLKRITSGEIGDVGDFKADLFRAVDERPLRKAVWISGHIVRPEIPDGSTELNISFDFLHDPGCDIWVIENRFMFSDETWSNSDIPFGYIDPNGDFVARPCLERLPDYYFSVDGALIFKSMALFGEHFYMSFTEVEAEYGPDYLSRLSKPDGQIVAEFICDTAPLSIIGCTLTALLNIASTDAA